MIRCEIGRGKMFHLLLVMLMLKCLLEIDKLDILILRVITYERNLGY